MQLYEAGFFEVSTNFVHTYFIPFSLVDLAVLLYDIMQFCASLPFFMIIVAFALRTLCSFPFLEREEWIVSHKEYFPALLLPFNTRRHFHPTLFKTR